VNNNPGIPGKKFVPLVGIGFLLFTIFMGLGTYYFAQITQPYFERKAKEDRLSGKWVNDTKRKF